MGGRKPGYKSLHRVASRVTILITLFVTAQEPPSSSGAHRGVSRSRGGGFLEQGFEYFCRSLGGTPCFGEGHMHALKNNARKRNN